MVVFARRWRAGFLPLSQEVGAALNLYQGLELDGGLVSCLMVTQASRWRKGIPPALVSFQEQTYQSRELVIVTADPHPAMDDLGFDINVMPPETKLGALRQRALELASGEYVATWDDDDLSYCRRLEEQIATLAAMPLADACLLLRVTIQDEIHRPPRTFISPRHAWEMTMVARRESVPAYRPDMDEGEDSDSIRRMGQVVVLDLPDLYKHTVHAGATVAKRMVAEWFAARTGGAL